VVEGQLFSHKATKITKWGIPGYDLFFVASCESIWFRPKAGLGESVSESLCSVLSGFSGVKGAVVSYQGKAAFAMPAVASGRSTRI
jgi:hypothetical protein